MRSATPLSSAYICRCPAVTWPVMRTGRSIAIAVALLFGSAVAYPWGLAGAPAAVAAPGHADPVATQVDPETGDTIEVFEDGTIRTTAPDGSVTVTKPGAQGGIQEDPETGALTGVTPDGGIVTRAPDGTIGVTPPPDDGGSQVDPATGNTITVYPDGQVESTDPSGKTTVLSGPPDDAGSQVDPATGNTITVYPDGQIESTDPSGKTTVVSGPPDDGAVDPNTGEVVLSTDSGITRTDPSTGATTLEPAFDGGRQVDPETGVVTEVSPDGTIRTFDPRTGRSQYDFPSPQGGQQTDPTTGVVRSADLDGNVLIRGPGIGSGLESSPPGTPVWQRDPAKGRITTVDLSGRVTVWDPNDPFYSDGAPPMPEGATQVDPLTGITTHVDPNTGAVTVTIPEIPGLPDDTTPADLDPLGGSVLGALPANPTANLAGKHGAADGSFNASACVLDAQAGGAVSPGEAILACADAATAWKNTQAPAVQSPMAQTGPEPSPSTEPLPICQGVHYPPIGMSGTQQAESVLWASLPADPPAAFGEIGAFWDGVVASVAEWCTCGGNHGNSDKNKGKEKDKGDKDDDNDNKGENDKTKEREARDAEKQKADENQGITIISHEPLPAASSTTSARLPC